MKKKAMPIRHRKEGKATGNTWHGEGKKSLHHNSVNEKEQSCRFNCSSRSHSCSMWDVCVS